MVTAANASETRRREQLREHLQAVAPDDYCKKWMDLEAAEQIYADAGPGILVMCALQTNNPRRAERIERQCVQLGLWDPEQTLTHALETHEF